MSEHRQDIVLTIPTGSGGWKGTCICGWRSPLLASHEAARLAAIEHVAFKNSKSGSAIGREVDDLTEKQIDDYLEAVTPRQIGDVLSEEEIAEILSDLNYEVHRDVADEFERARMRLAETLRAFASRLTDAEDALREIRSVETWTWAEANEIIDAHFAKYESED